MMRGRSRSCLDGVRADLKLDISTRIDRGG